MKKRWLLLVIIIIIAGLSYGLYAWWHAQATTSTVSYGTQTSSDVLGSENQLVDWQTMYFTTKITTSLRQITTSETPGKSIMGSYLFTSTSVRKTDQLAITIGTFSNYSLDEISAVKFRLNQPTEYTPVSRTFAPPGALAFNRANSYETSVFWQHADKYAAVVVSGTANDKADLEQALSDVVSNWQWK